MRSITSSLTLFSSTALSKWVPSQVKCTRTAPSSLTVRCRLDVKRPTLDDVQRLSEGRAAKSRGTGSRQVPHRLNQEERQLYTLARAKGFLTLRGSGYRRERKGSPLANIYRQLSDVEGRACVLLEQDSGVAGEDVLLVDLSPLRLMDTSAAEVAVQQLAAEAGVAALPVGTHSSPFTVIVPNELLDLPISTAVRAQQPPDDDTALDEPGVPEPVANPGSKVEEREERALRHLFTAPIWQQPPRLVCFRCPRPAAKALAKLLAERLDKELQQQAAAAAKQVAAAAAG